VCDKRDIVVDVEVRDTINSLVEEKQIFHFSVITSGIGA
jgi:hypothetical protein